jgi:DNA-binding FadR family transcriptional regulator
VKSPVVEHRLCRLAAQAAVGRHPLRDVLLSLRRAGLILSFRLQDDVLVVKAQRTLTFMFETVDFQ